MFISANEPFSRDAEYSGAEREQARSGRLKFALRYAKPSRLGLNRGLAFERKSASAETNSAGDRWIPITGRLAPSEPELGHRSVDFSPRDNLLANLEISNSAWR